MARYQAMEENPVLCLICWLNREERWVLDVRYHIFGQGHFPAVIPDPIADRLIDQRKKEVRIWLA